MDGFPVFNFVSLLCQWCQLKQRKENLLKLFENMREFQLDKVMENPDAPIPENMRLIKDEDIERYLFTFKVIKYRLLFSQNRYLTGDS